MSRKGNNDDGCIERPHRLHAQQLESHPAGDGLAECVDAGLRGATKLAGLGRKTLALARELFRITPGQADTGPAPPI